MSPQSIHAFAEKVALVTDGSSRIGRAAALQLALQGSFVIVGFPPGSGSKDALIELKSLGTLADAVEMDISRPEGAKNLVDSVQNIYGRLDLLVNCLKLNDNSTFRETSPDGFQRVMDANFGSAFFVSQFGAELMAERPKARIVNVVSACDTGSTAANTAFAASQAAVVQLTRSLAETLPKSFRVNCVQVSEKERPGDGVQNDLFAVDKGVPADDVARVILYLLSGEAVGLNGQILVVK